MRKLEKDDFFHVVVHDLSLSEAVAQAALSSIEEGKVALLAVNGKLASGKDTIAPAVMARLGVTDALHNYYAVPLKAEVDSAVAMITMATSPDEASAALVEQFGIEPAQAGFVTGVLWHHTRATGHGLTARSRTPEMRTVLQYWGTEVRRRQDSDYWVKRAMVPAVEAISRGQSVYFTDVRFANEVEWAQRLGFFVVRLEVSPEVQHARHVLRDGTEPNPDTLTHPSETSLDGYPGFDLVVDNNGEMIPTVLHIAQEMAESTRLVHR